MAIIPFSNTSSMRGASFLVPFGKRFTLFVCVTILCFIVGAVVVALVASRHTTPALRVATVLQDVLLFIMPALVTACLITRMPARFLMADSRPSAFMTVLGVMALFASVPAMNALVAWNSSIELPSGLSSLELAMKQAEDAAKESVNLIIGQGNSIGSYIMAILIVAVMAGFSEELFFRGTLQRILCTGPVNAHVAIWFTAFVFSAIHMQFYGFVPRLILGAYFGYLAWWSRSIWVPVIVHVVNNAVVVTGMFVGEDFGCRFDTVGTISDDMLYLTLSVSLTAVILAVMARTSRQKTIKEKQ